MAKQERVGEKEGEGRREGGGKEVHRGNNIHHSHARKAGRQQRERGKKQVGGQRTNAEEGENQKEERTTTHTHAKLKGRQK